MSASISPEHLVTSMEALERLYAEPFGPSLVKETDRITGPYGAFIEAAPFFALASGGPDGFDCSPRGDAPGFVRVQDEKTLLIPDRRGNNRIDTLRNILQDPRVALLFLIPGCGVTIRVNGSSPPTRKLVKPNLATLLKDFYERGDRQRLYLARIDVK